jgi:octaprenyl-diphosphate synthase
MKDIEKIICSFFDPAIAEYFAKIPAGKMLRSKLIRAIAGENERSFLLGAIVETIHLASLLHDDIIDNAATRRGVPSLYASEGAITAVMIGDIFYSTAFAKLTTFGEKIAYSVANSVAKLSRGELEDIRLANSLNTDRESYENMIYLKTAALIESSCESAAILSGKDSEIYREFGKKLGIAFQIIDDLLDLTQSQDILGKPAMSDLSEGKATLPIIYLYQNGDQNDRDLIVNLFKKKIDQNNAEILLDRLNKIGAIAESQKYALSLLKEAQGLIPNDAALITIAAKLVDRIK